MTDSEDLDLAIEKAFVLHCEHEIAAYDWVWSAFIELCEKAPLRAYKCIVHLADLEYPNFSTAVMCAGNLKLLLESSADKVLPMLVEDLKSMPGMRYALAAAMSFGVYTGSSKFDEHLAGLDESYSLKELYRHYYDNDIDVMIKQGKGFEFVVEDLVLRCCPEAKATDGVAFEASNKNQDDRIRIRGRVDIGEIVSLNSKISECLEINRRTCRYALGGASNVEFVLECFENGQIDVRVNFWIDGLLMPQLIELKADQTHLQILRERFDVLMRAI